MSLRGRLNELFLFLKDFYFLQETHACSSDVNFWTSQWGSDIWHSFGSNHSAGVSILKGSFKGKIVSSKVHNGGRWIILTVSIDGKLFLLGTVYASNIKKYNVDLFSNIEIEINKVRERFHDIEFILGGGFNIVPDVKNSYSN